jgi:NitT/TauT family transport system permease protein
MDALSPPAAAVAVPERSPWHVNWAVGRQMLANVLLPIATVALLLLVWEFAVRHYAISSGLLPAPHEVWERLMATWPTLLRQAVPTSVETLLSFFVATFLGVVLGVVLTYSRLIAASLYPGVVFFQLIPKVALAPLFVVWFGIGGETRVAFGVFIAFFPIVVATMAGLRDTPPDMLRLCRGLTATSWQMFVHVRLPFALPQIFSGMKIAVTLAMIGVIVAEFISAQAGLGYLIVFASSQADTALILAAILVLCIIGLAYYALVVLGERLAIRMYGPN